MKQLWCQNGWIFLLDDEDEDDEDDEDDDIATVTGAGEE